MKKINGVMTALVTPFKEDKQIDWDAFDKLLDMQVEAKVDAVVISGTTGESPTLSVQEKLSLVRRAKAKVSNDLLVVAGSGDNDSVQSVELSKLSLDAGADALLVVTPPYNKPSLEGLKLHFSMISEATNAPIILYHVPSRTGQLLDANQMAELCKIDHIVAIKEASGDLKLFSETHRLTENIELLSGDDFTYLASLAVGGTGVISVVTNIFPAAFVEMTRAFQKGDHKKACAIHEILLPVNSALFCESNPAPTKAILEHLGIAKANLRAPLVQVGQANLERIIASYENARSALNDLLGS